MLSIGILFYKVIHLDPLEQTLIQKIKINNLANIYITQASAGATTGFSYRYYVLDASLKEGEALALFASRQKIPFLITDDKQAAIKVGDRCITIKINGTIYTYSSPAAYHTATGIYYAPLCLEARPW